MKKEVLINGRKIVYFEEGEGPAFLVIHGWGHNAVSQFFPLQDMLVNCGYRVILLSLPGFGENGFSLPRWGTEEYINCILDFISKINLENFFLIGHSMGGAMAIRLAATNSERIKALVLLSPGVMPSPSFSIWGWRCFVIVLHGWSAIVKTWELFLALFVTIFKNLTLFIVKMIRIEKAVDWLDGFLRRTIRKTTSRLGLARIQYRLIKTLNRIAKSANTLPYLSMVKCPVLTIWGERDFNFNFPLIGGARYMGRIPNYIFKIIPEAGHQLQEDAPEKVSELITDFIKKLEP